MSGGRGALPYMPLMFTFLGKIMSLKMNLLAEREGVVWSTDGGRHSFSFSAHSLPPSASLPDVTHSGLQGSHRQQQPTEAVWGDRALITSQEPHHTPLREKGWQNGTLQVAQWHLGLSLLLTSQHVPLDVVELRHPVAMVTPLLWEGKQQKPPQVASFFFHPLFMSLYILTWFFIPVSRLIESKEHRTGLWEFTEVSKNSPSGDLHRCSWCRI